MADKAAATIVSHIAFTLSLSFSLSRSPTHSLSLSVPLSLTAVIFACTNVNHFHADPRVVCAILIAAH